MHKKFELSGLRNIGPTIERRPNEIGVYTKQDLKRVGAVGAYRKMKAKYPKTIPIYHYFVRLKGLLQEGTGTTCCRQSKTSRAKEQVELN